MMEGKIEAVCISKEKGTSKEEVPFAKFIENFGIEGDAHSGFGSLKQISLLSFESLEKMKKKFKDLKFGSFAENLCISWIDFSSLKIGNKLKINDEVIIEITQIGKKCNVKCEIYKKVGKCIMPKEGIFAKVLKGGFVRKGDKIILC